MKLHCPFCKEKVAEILTGSSIRKGATMLCFLCYERMKIADELMKKKQTSKTGIYGIHNIINNKWYVGQSVNIPLRKKNHFYRLQGNYHFNSHLQNAFIKYGKVNFKFYILEEVPENKLDIRERAWIDYYKSASESFGYNNDSGGHANKHPSEKTRQKLSEAGKGHVVTEETREKLSNAHRGRKFPPERCLKMSEIRGEKHHLFGKHRSEETKMKISKSNKGRIHSIQSRHNMSEAHKGYKTSEETKRKLSITSRAMWEKRRHFQN